MTCIHCNVVPDLIHRMLQSDTAITHNKTSTGGVICSGMPYKKESCQLWWAMLKAAITLQMDVEPMITSCANSLLRDTFRLCEWLSDEWRTDEAEEWLLQAQQVTNHAVLLHSVFEMMIWPTVQHSHHDDRDCDTAVFDHASKQMSHEGMS